MIHKNLGVQLVGVACLLVSIPTTGSASRKEELERAAELAVERTAEIVAERAVEKALESGNSSTETETIRMSHSSVRKHDSTWQFPDFEYSPRQYKDYERIMSERAAGERAVARIKRRRLARQAFDNEKNEFNPAVKNIDISTFPFRSTPFQFSSDQYQYQYQYPFTRQADKHAENGDNNFHSDYGKLIQQPLKTYQIHRTSLPVVYFFSPPINYPVYGQYSQPHESPQRDIITSSP